MSREELIEKLGIQDKTDAQQDMIIEAVQEKIGDKITKNLDEQQLNEYQAIIDGDQSVIDAWLEQNMPDYKDTPIYKEVEAGFEEDPEHVPGDKVVASVMWIQFNVPNIGEIVDEVVEAYKEGLAHV